jgi:hypothetical protein
MLRTYIWTDAQDLPRLTTYIGVEIIDLSLSAAAYVTDAQDAKGVGSRPGRSA